jgi:competence/damage-inducible protein CinA-like protein
MPTAEIIAIGTELLLGDNVDTNTAFIAHHLRDHGIDLYRTSIVGDNKNRIAEMIRESLTRADIVITTGGLGPTVDDPTRAAVAFAFDRELEFQEPLWEAIQRRFSLLNRTATENNRNQAYIPYGSIPINNPVGTAPAFVMDFEDKIVASLPGVPGEMQVILLESILPFIQNKYQLQSVIRSYILHCSGIGESAVDDIISDLEKSKNPTVGLLAHPGLVDIRITARAEDASAAEILIEPFREMIQNRLAENIFGEGDQTLTSVVLASLKQANVPIHVYTSSLEKNKQEILFPDELLSVLIFHQIEDAHSTDIFKRAFQTMIQGIMEPCLGFFSGEDQFRQEFFLIWNWRSNKNQLIRFFAGPPASVNKWKQNMLLDFVRRNLS